jgi:hypothetical protein
MTNYPLDSKEILFKHVLKRFPAGTGAGIAAAHHFATSCSKRMQGIAPPLADKGAYFF